MNIINKLVKLCNLKDLLLNFIHYHQIPNRKKCNHISHEVEIILLSQGLSKLVQNTMHLFSSLTIFCSINIFFAEFFIIVEIVS